MPSDNPARFMVFSTFAYTLLTHAEAVKLASEYARDDPESSILIAEAVHVVRVANPRPPIIVEDFKK